MALDQLDTRIALMAQAPQIDFNQLAGNTLQLYDNIKQRGQQGLLSRLLAQNTGLDGQVDLNGALLSAQTNPSRAYQPNMVNTLSGMIQQQNAAQVKAQQDEEDRQLSLRKGNAEVGEKEFGNNQKAQTSLANLIATSTSPSDALAKVGSFGQQYGLPPEVIKSASAMLSGYVTDAENGTANFEKMRKSFGLLGAEKPIEYMEADANNKLTNKTSASNNAATVGASIYGTNVGAKTAANKLTQDGQQFKATLDFNKSQIPALYTAQQQDIKNGAKLVNVEGTMYLDFGGGKGEIYVDKNGQPVKATSNTGGVKTQTAQIEEQQRTQKVSMILDEVEEILPNATHSGFGNLLDKTSRFFGKANSGDVATGQLGTLGGQLVALMPKMSGPQSDKDVEMYKQMAGKLDDPSTPIEIRMAALQTIRDLNSKYSQLNENRGRGIPYANAGQIDITFMP